MKFSNFATILLVLNVASSVAFVPHLKVQKSTVASMGSVVPTWKKDVQSSASKKTELLMESDFASAMPEAPQLTKREFLEQAADKTLASIQGALGEDVEPVPAVAELQETRNDPNSSEENLAAAIYTLMIERGMTYDEEPDTGILTPTNFDIPSNLEVAEVKEEFLFLYRYGMQLISSGYVSVDTVKGIVQERLISRTGLSPEEFDEWLGF